MAFKNKKCTAEYGKTSRQDGTARYRPMRRSKSWKRGSSRSLL